MQLHYEPITLDLAAPFRIAHGTSFARHNVLVSISDGEHVGRGEAAPVRQHHETQEGVLDYLAALSLAGLSDRDMPELVEPGAVVGPLQDEAAREMGLRAGIPVVADLAAAVALIAAGSLVSFPGLSLAALGFVPPAVVGLGIVLGGLHLLAQRKAIVAAEERDRAESARNGGETP